MGLRLVFMGTPEFAVPTLLELIGAGHQIEAVYTRAPRPGGRGLAARPTPIATAAERFGIPVFTPPTLRDPAVQEGFRGHLAEAAVVVAYGLILPRPILEAAPLGCFNLHASKLPRWRGAAPIHRAVMAGDTETAVAVMKMAEGLDTGPVGLMEMVGIGADMTTGELHDVLAKRGADLMVRAVGALERGSLVLQPQPEAGVTYAAKIDKAETRITWQQPAAAVHNHCRGLAPIPGAWFPLDGDGQEKRVKVLRTQVVDGGGAPGTVLDTRLTVACAEGAVRLLSVQRASGEPMGAAEFLRGVTVHPGQILR